MKCCGLTGILVLWVIFGCQNKSASGDRLDQFVAKFTPSEPYMLKVYSDEEYTNYQGTEIDSAEAYYFPAEITKAHFAAPPGIFACQKITIDADHTGLIARTPSGYDASSIRFFILDKKSQTLSKGLELAENFGIGNKTIQKTAWVYRNKSKQPEAFIWTRVRLDRSKADDNDSFVETYDRFCLVSLANARFDTLSTNAADLSVRFATQLREAHLWRD